MIKHESKSSVLFRHWLMANPQFTCSWEVKDTRGLDYISFSEIKQAQIDYGMAIKHSDKGVLIRTDGVEGLPDYIYVRKEPAWIIIKYPKSFEIIDVETFAMERYRSKRRSLTYERAQAISVQSVLIPKKMR